MAATHTFRNELAAAHAKIAQLEEQLRQLQDEQRAKAVQSPKSRGSQPSLWLVVAAGTILMVGVIAVGAFSIRQQQVRSSSTGSESFQGIATADPPKTRNAIPPIVNPGVVASASAKAKSNPCNCTPGDPLCSCL
jgi:hypothetical protein